MSTALVRISKAAARLAAAYDETSRIALAPDAAPQTPPEAMQVQAEVMRLLDVEVGGWKVSVRPDGLEAAAPMFRHWVVPEGRSFPILRNGPIGIEVEIGLRLAKDLPPRPGKPYTRPEILAACDRAFAGIEVVTPRLANQNDIPFTHFLADNVGNGGYVIGGGIGKLADIDLSALRCVIEIDGRVVHDKIGGNPWTDPLVPVVACANAQMDHVGGFKAGQIVTTGSLCGVIWRPAGERIAARIEGLGTVAMET